MVAVKVKFHKQVRYINPRCRSAAKFPLDVTVVSTRQKRKEKKLMKLLFFLSTALPYLAWPATASPRVVDGEHLISYHGLDRNGIEVFLGIPYAQDTGGVNRFKPPRKHIPVPGTSINATSYGPSCPQPLGQWAPPITLANITQVSEDCLNLNVARPRGTAATDRLPVMVYIHGGGFWAGDKQDPTILPDALVLESVRNGLPVLHVAMNYRLGGKCRLYCYVSGQVRSINTNDDESSRYSLWICAHRRAPL